MISFNKINSPTNKDEIRKLEKKWRITLPEVYKKFLLQNNGGRVGEEVFPIQNNPSGDRAIIHSFFGLNLDNVYDLDSKLRVYKAGQRIPDNFIPIACDVGGNLVCISFKGEDEGKVYFWDHEDEYMEGEKVGYKNVYLVADNLEEFINSLRKDEE